MIVRGLLVCGKEAGGVMNRGTSVALGIAVGAGVGTTLGVIFGNIALGAALGAGLGVVVGSMFDLDRTRRRSSDR